MRINKINGVDLAVTESEKTTIQADITTNEAGITSLDVKVDNLEQNQVTGVETYAELTDLPGTGVLLVSYKVTNDTVSSTNNGFYHWDGAVYIKDASAANGEITAGNTEAVEGGKIYTETTLRVLSNKEFYPYIPIIIGKTPLTVEILKNFILGLELSGLTPNPSLFYSPAVIDKTPTDVRVRIYSMTSEGGGGYIQIADFASTDILNEELLIEDEDVGYILINPTAIPDGSFSEVDYENAGFDQSVFNEFNSLLINEIRDRENITNNILDLSNELIDNDTFFVQTDGDIGGPISTFKYTTEIRVTPKGNYSLTISVVPSGSYAIVAYYDIDMVFISSFNQSGGSVSEVKNYILQVPDNGFFVRFTGHVTAEITLISDSITTLYMAESADFSVIENQFVIPKYIDVAINEDCNIYLDCITKNVNFKKDPLLIEGDVSIVRTGSSIKYKPASIVSDIPVKFIKTNDQLSEKYSVETNLRTVPITGGGAVTKNIVLIGDSLTDNDFLATETYSKLDADGDFTANQVGTRGVVGGKNEGRGGWKWSNYLTSDFLGIDNAFYIGGQLDFQQYCTDNGFGDLDYVIIQLGTNDVTQGTVLATDESIALIIADSKIFIDALMDSGTGFPNCRVAIALPAVGSEATTTNINMEIFRRSIQLLNQAYIDTYDDGLYNSNITCLASGLWINRYNSYPFVDEPISDRISATQRVFTNAVHPLEVGYYQFADAYYSKIRTFLSGTL
jgi:lysophospholipase L1-like esterase